MENIIQEILNELERASSINPKFFSTFEGFGVLLEEYEELWDEIKKNPKTRSFENTRKEAIQVGAMAFRFLIDCVENDLDKWVSLVRSKLNNIPYPNSTHEICMWMKYNIDKVWNTLLISLPFDDYSHELVFLAGYAVRLISFLGEAP